MFPLPAFAAPIAAELLTLAGQASKIVNVGEVLKVAVEAELSGGPSAVVPALLANLPSEVNDPNVLAALQFMLKFGQYAPAPAAPAAGN